MNLIQQYGSMRSGTNYIRWLVMKNFRDTYVVDDNKHSGPKKNGKETYSNKWLKKYKQEVSSAGFDLPNGFATTLQNAQRADKIGYLIIVKNPYSVVQGHISARNKDGSSLGHTIDKCVKWWNVENHQYTEFLDKNPDKTLLVKYEDLLLEENRNQVLDTIASKFGLQRAKEPYEDIVRHAHNMTHNYDNKERYDKEFQLNKKYLKFTAGELKEFNAKINRILLKRFGYSFEERLG